MNVLERIRRTYRNLNKKAVSDYYPGLKNREHISVGYSADVSTMAIENYVGHGILYRSYVWVHKAVALISDSIAPLPVQVVDAQNKPLPGHDVSMALARANDSMDASKMWAILTAYKLLGGEWFLEVVPDRKGRPAEFWPRRPDQVLVIADDARPAYPHPYGYQLLGTGIDDTIPPEYMIQDSFINPLSVWRGLSPIAAVLSGIKLDILNQAYSLNFVQGNARPDYAVEVTEALTPDERARAEAQITQKYSGPDGWHRPMLLENGQKIHVLSFPPKDMEGLEQRRVSRDEVAAIFGIPDILMGFGNDSYDTEEKREAAEAALWTMTLTPLIFRRDTVLTWHFQRTRHLKPGERVATDLSGVSVLQEDLLPKLDAAQKLFGLGVPYNVIENRLKLGTGAIPNGDTGYLPMNLLPIAQIAAPPPVPIAPTVAPAPAEQPAPDRPAEAPAAQPVLAASIERRVAPVLKLEKAAGQSVHQAHLCHSSG